jgi:hypothetical protein
MGKQYQRLALAAFVLCGLVLIDSGPARALTYDVTGTNSLGDTLTGTIQADGTVSTFTSLNLVDSALTNPITNGTLQGFSGPVLVASPANPSGPFVSFVYISFTGPPASGDVNQAVLNAYNISLSLISAMFDPSTCNGDLSCQALLAQEQSAYDAAAALGYNSSFTATAVSATPLPAALPLYATGLGALTLLGWLRKRKAAVA